MIERREDRAVSVRGREREREREMPQATGWVGRGGGGGGREEGRGGGARGWDEGGPGDVKNSHQGSGNTRRSSALQLEPGNLPVHCMAKCPPNSKSLHGVLLLTGPRRR